MVGLEQEVVEPHLQVVVAVAVVAEEDTCHLVLGVIPGVLRCFQVLEAFQEEQCHCQWGGCWLPQWESFGLAWAAQASWSLALVSDLAGGDGAEASDGASEGKEGAADEATCQGVQWFQVGPDQVLLSAGVLAEDSGHVAAVPFAAGLVTQHISIVPCGSSGVQ